MQDFIATGWLAIDESWKSTLPSVDFASLAPGEDSSAVDTKKATDADAVPEAAVETAANATAAPPGIDAAAPETKDATAERPKDARSSATGSDFGCNPKTSLPALATLRLRNFCGCVGLPIEDVEAMCSLLEIKEKAQAIKSCQSVEDIKLIESEAELQIVAANQMVTAMKNGEKDMRVMSN